MSERSPVPVSYAGALLELAEREDALERYGELIGEVATLYREEPRFRAFLETPRVRTEAKRQSLRLALGERAPEHFLKFLLVVVDKRRQAALPDIAEAYGALADQREGRVRASLTLAREADAGLRERLTRELSRLLEREVIASFRANEHMLGGIVVRVGDRVLDGSMRRRLRDLKRALLEPLAV